MKNIFLLDFTVNGPFKIFPLNNMNISRTLQVKERPMKATDYEKIQKDFCKNSWQESYTKYHRQLIETKQNKFIIFQCARAGWGGRCLNLLKSFHVAVITRRVFIIVCNEPIPFLKYLEPRNIRWNYIVNETGLSVRKNARLLDTSKNYHDPTIFEKMLNYSVEYEPRIPYSHLYFSNLLKYDLPVWPNHDQMMGCHYYYLFKKSDFLKKRIEDWKEKLGFNENIVLGIHIREGDVVFHDGYEFDKRATMSDIERSFECAVKVEKLITEKHKTNRIIWFLAADSEEIKSYAVKKYGSKVK